MNRAQAKTLSWTLKRHIWEPGELQALLKSKDEDCLTIDESQRYIIFFMNKVCAIGLLAYDHELLLKTLPSYIDLVDQVILGVDRRRLTWTGNKFEIPEVFFEQLNALDSRQKVQIVEDDFFVEGLTPMELEVRERNILSKRAIAGSWLLSVDADEYLLHPSDLIEFLRGFSDDRVILYGTWFTLFKSSDKQLFVIENEPELMERFPLATMKPEAFTYGRGTKQRIVFTSTCAVHYSWARTREELERKLRNWGHRDDFKIEEFIAQWESLNTSNYQQFVDFHPFEPKMWQRLTAVDEDSLINYAKQKCEEFNLYMSWKSVPLQARMGLFEEKVIARDAATAAMKAELEEKINELNKQLAQRETEPDQPARKPGLFDQFFGR